MKFISHFSGWAVAIGAGLFCAAASLIQADPTDDLSFTLAQRPELKTYSLMSETRVAEILADHLDLFPKSQAPKLSRHLLRLCRQFRFDPAFVLSLIQVESSFKIKASSQVGAVGLMQIMPATADVIAARLDLDVAQRKVPMLKALEDPYINLTIGVAYLAYLRDRYEGLSPYYLVAAYNLGPARLDELLSRKSFKPEGTKKYYEAIRRNVPEFRFYTRLAESRSLRRPRSSQRAKRKNRV